MNCVAVHSCCWYHILVSALIFTWHKFGRGPLTGCSKTMWCCIGPFKLTPSPCVPLRYYIHHVLVDPPMSNHHKLWYTILQGWAIPGSANKYNTILDPPPPLVTLCVSLKICEQPLNSLVSFMYIQQLSYSSASPPSMCMHMYIT